MARYTITATVVVDVEVSLDADSESAARKMLSEHLIMTAGFVDLPEGSADVSEDSIADIDDVKIRLEAA